MPFVLNVEKFKALCSLRGWKHPQTDLASATGYSVSYINRVLNGKEKLSDVFMIKYISAAGVDISNYKEWGPLFEVTFDPAEFLNRQKMNYEKFEGRVPYVNPSPSYDFRKIDDPHLEQQPEPTYA